MVKKQLSTSAASLSDGLIGINKRMVEWWKGGINNKMVEGGGYN
jgi:hypothetical protein